MSYYPEPDIHIRQKVKVVLYLSNYTTKKELAYVARVSKLKADKLECWSIKSCFYRLEKSKGCST